MQYMLQKTIKTFFVLSMAAIFAGQSTAAFAQAASSSQSAASIQMSVSPSSPNAGDGVTLTLSSDSMDLSSANITWYVDGVAGEQGYGQTTLTITAKAAGQSTSVKAVAQTSDGTTAQTSTTITPGGVDLIVEPTSYVPPFYKGEAIFTTQGTVRVVAIPNVLVNGKQASAKSLIFDWQENGSSLQSESGLGADSISVSGSVPIRDLNVSVSVLDASGNILAGSSKILSPADPQVLVYENNPLYGILFNKAVTGNYYLGQRTELDLIAKPYFFDLGSDSGSDSTYKWLVNGNYVSPSGKDNELILQQTTQNLTGTAAISLTVNNNVRIFQYANTDFNINFGI